MLTLDHPTHRSSANDLSAMSDSPAHQAGTGKQAAVRASHGAHVPAS